MTCFHADNDSFLGKLFLSICYGVPLNFSCTQNKTLSKNKVCPFWDLLFQWEEAYNMQIYNLSGDGEWKEGWKSRECWEV